MYLIGKDILIYTGAFNCKYYHTDTESMQSYLARSSAFIDTITGMSLLLLLTTVYHGYFVDSILIFRRL